MPLVRIEWLAFRWFIFGRRTELYCVFFTYLPTYVPATVTLREIHLHSVFAQS